MSELFGQRVKEMLAGDEAAYEWLLDSFETPVYRFFMSSVRDEGRAIELSGEVFGEFVVALKENKLRDPACLPGFVFGIARNVLRRSRQQRPVVSLDQQAEGHQVACDRSRGPEQVVTRETLTRAFQLIEQFRSLDRQVMLLRFVEGQSLKEIAASLAIPVNTVKVTIHRCRQKIQRDYQQVS